MFDILNTRDIREGRRPPTWCCSVNGWWNRGARGLAREPLLRAIRNGKLWKLMIVYILKGHRMQNKIENITLMKFFFPEYASRAQEQNLLYLRQWRVSRDFLNVKAIQGSLWFIRIIFNLPCAPIITGIIIAFKCCQLLFYYHYKCYLAIYNYNNIHQQQQLYGTFNINNNAYL